MRLRGLEHPSRLLHREGNPLAEGIDRVRQPLLCHGGKHRVADEIEIAVAVVPEFRRQGMSTQIAGHHIHRPPLPERAGDAEHLDLGVLVEAVPRLDLDGGYALGQQRVEPLESRGRQVSLRRGPRGAHRRGDAAPGPGDLGIGDARQPLLEFIGPAAAIDQVGVAIDEPRGGEAPLAIQGLVTRRSLKARANPCDPAALDQHRRILDQAIAIPHRGDVQVGEQHGGSLLYKVVYTV
jgi:hypothetical protein